MDLGFFSEISLKKSLSPCQYQADLGLNTSSVKVISTSEELVLMVSNLCIW